MYKVKKYYVYQSKRDSKNNDDEIMMRDEKIAACLTIINAYENAIDECKAYNVRIKLEENIPNIKEIINYVKKEADLISNSDSLK